MMKKFAVLIIFILLTCSSGMADENGGYAGSFLRMGLGARSISLGDAGAADKPNGFSFFYNPALVGMIEEKVVSLSYSFLSQDRRYQYVGFSMKVPPGAGFSIGWIESGVDNLSSYNSIGQNTGEINHSANAVYFTFGRKFGSKLSIGVSIKLLLEYINDGTDSFDYSSKGVGGDFGAVYRYNEKFTIAAVVKDVGSKLEANTENIFERGGTTIDYFPVTYRVGIGYITPYPWLRALYDFEWSDKGSYDHHIGFEALQGENLALRLGLNGDQPEVGLGMDFKLSRFLSHLDYAFVPSIIDEGSSHIFSWQVYIR